MFENIKTKLKIRWILAIGMASGVIGLALTSGATDVVGVHN
jgi:hypothetical protein